jgi:hypothetical protein
MEGQSMVFDLGASGSCLDSSFGLAFDGLLNSVAEVLVGGFFTVSGICQLIQHNSAINVENKKQNFYVVSRLINKIQAVIQETGFQVSNIVEESSKALIIEAKGCSYDEIKNFITGNDYSAVSSKLNALDRVELVCLCAERFGVAFRAANEVRRKKTDPSLPINSCGTKSASIQKLSSGKAHEDSISQKKKRDPMTMQSAIFSSSEDNRIRRILHKEASPDPSHNDALNSKLGNGAIGNILNYFMSRRHTLDAPADINQSLVSLASHKINKSKSPGKVELQSSDPQRHMPNFLKKRKISQTVAGSQSVYITKPPSNSTGLLAERPKKTSIQSQTSRPDKKETLVVDSKVKIPVATSTVDSSCTDQKGAKKSGSGSQTTSGQASVSDNVSILDKKRNYSESIEFVPMVIQPASSKQPSGSVKDHANPLDLSLADSLANFGQKPIPPFKVKSFHQSNKSLDSKKDYFPIGNLALTKDAFVGEIRSPDASSINDIQICSIYSGKKMDSAIKENSADESPKIISLEMPNKVMVVL